MLYPGGVAHAYRQHGALPSWWGVDWIKPPDREHILSDAELN